MTRAVGLDLSLTATGVAIVSSSGDWEHVTAVKTKATDYGDAWDARGCRLDRLSGSLSDFLRPEDLVCLEGPSYGSTGGSAFDRAALWWTVYRNARALGCHLAVIEPTRRTKWATGNGRSSKVAVASAVARLWPAVQFADDNEADAMVLAAMGSCYLGRPLAATTAYRDEIMRKIEWPQLS